MGKPAPIPPEIKKERIQVLRSVTLDELLTDTLVSQFSYTDIIWNFIAIALDEYLFMREKEMVAKSGDSEPLIYPMRPGGGEYSAARESARERLAQEFRERFCSDPPNRRIEWEKLGEFLQSRMPINSG